MTLCFLAAANSIHSIRWIRYFAEHGHDIHWVSLAPPIPEAASLADHVHFHEVSPSPLADLSGRRAIFHLLPAVATLRRILRATKPEILHVHSAGTYGLVGALARFHPSILTPWGSDVLLTSRLVRPLLRFIVRSFDLLTCDGENTSRRLVELEVAPSKVRRIMFGTDVEQFKPATRPPRGEERELTVVSLRSLEPIYDIETLLRAAAMVIARVPRARFLIAGDGSERTRLEVLARNLGLGASVTFLGRIENDTLPALLQRAHIYVSTALSDSGLAASTAEAMSCGLPAVVTDSGDNRAWVAEGEGGFVVPLKAPELLAQKIVALALDRKARKRFGAHNRKLIEERNNYHREMQKMEQLYEEITKRHQAATR